MSDSPRLYRLAEHADGDLRSIVAYIGQERPQAAARIIVKLAETFRTLADSPNLGTACEDIGPGVRMFSPEPPAARYVIFFRHAEAPQRVEIVGVIDAARDWSAVMQARSPKS